MRHFLCTSLLLLLLPIASMAQQYTGMSGFIHVPSGEMNYEGDARIGAHFLNKHMTPDTGFIYQASADEEGYKYNTYDYYLDITPLKWLELAYTCTERKHADEGNIHDYRRKDRYLSIKIQPLKERQYLPAIAIGCNDVGTTIKEAATESNVQLYFHNYYIAATKHFDIGFSELTANLAFRHFLRGYNAKWNGLVGAIAFRPAYFKNTRLIAEYTGNELLVGFDALLWRHLLVQASLKDFRYPNFGICYQVNLLGKQYQY